MFSRRNGALRALRQADLEFRRSAAMAEHTSETPAVGKALPPGEIVSLFNTGEWYIVGGAGARGNLQKRIFRATWDGVAVVLSLCGDSSDPSASSFPLVLGDVVLREASHRLVMRRFTLQLCDRPKSEGGCKHEKMLPAVYLLFHNKVLEEHLEKERQAKLEEEERKRLAEAVVRKKKEDEFIARLGLAGCEILKLEQGPFGPILYLADGRALKLSSRLDELHFELPPPF